jgi:hypothetical protein
MAENYRALVALLVLTIPVLWFVRTPLTLAVMRPADFNLRAVIWVALTILLFVAQSFWIFMLGTVLLLLAVGRRDSNPLGLYFFILLLAPPFQSAVQGFGGINYFISLDFLRLLSFVILLPTAIVLLTRSESAGLFRMPTDKYVLGYVVLLLAIQLPLTSTTDWLRSALSHLIDTLLPYYVFSRGITDLRRLRDTGASFVAACAILSVVAVFEVFKGWLLYSSLPNFLDVRWKYGSYMLRDGSLRATASTGHSIVLGYVVTVALGLHLMIRPAFANKAFWRNVLLVLCVGIVASMSRGPWVGAAGLILVALAVGPGAGKRLGTASLLLILSLPVLMLTPIGAKIVSYLPFVGDVDAGTVSYRQQLFEVSWNVLMLNPIFGSPYYMAYGTMEQLRQGEGIIDMVNSYLAVAMVSGFVGLTLFSGAFVSCGVRLYTHLARHPAKGGDDYVVGKALLATLVGIMLVIATASSINAIPVVYWCVVGMCAAYLRFASVPQQTATVQGPARPNALRQPSF